MYTTLISTQDLNARRNAFVIVDCRFELAQIARPEAGRQAYAISHIPGAFYAHLDQDLAGPIVPTSGRHPLPDPEQLAAIFRRWGISADSQVIAYDGDNGMFASRLWWLLRWLGHRAVAVLDGGFNAWQKANLPVSVETPATRSGKFVARPQNDMVVSTEAVMQLVKRSDWRLLDARAPERFRGDVEPIDPVAGHIPGARNHPFARNMDGAGLLLAPQALKTNLSAALDGVASDHSIMMCGSGVTACHNLLALEVAGLTGAKLYAGSWSEWIRDTARPIVKGNADGG